MTTFLLDANVLIALTIVEHEHHDRARDWLAGVERFTVCPIVEGALVRFLLRMGESSSTSAAVLAGIRAHQRCEFWTDDLSFQEVDLTGLRGHRQVTDAYLAALAGHHGGMLATFDAALAAAETRTVWRIP